MKDSSRSITNDRARMKKIYRYMKESLPALSLRTIKTELIMISQTVNELTLSAITSALPEHI